MSGPVKPVKMFVAYSHKDDALRDEFVKHLASLEHVERKVDCWYDGKVVAGHDLLTEIEFKLDSAEMIVLLLSKNYLASSACRAEMDRAFQRREDERVPVVPVVLSECDWKHTKASGPRALPHDGKPIDGWQNRDEAFVNVVRGVREAIEEVLGGRSAGAAHPQAALGDGAPSTRGGPPSSQSRPLPRDGTGDVIVGLDGGRPDAAQGNLIPDRVIDAIEKMQKGQHQLALDAILHAVDATARAEYPAERDDAARFKRFLQDNMEIVSSGLPVRGSGTITVANKFRSLRGMERFSEDEHIDVLDVIYYVAMKFLANESRLPSELEFVAENTISCEGQRVLLPIALVFSMAMSVVAARSNAGRAIGSGITATFQSGASAQLSQLWGRKEAMVRLLDPTRPPPPEGYPARPPASAARNDPCPCGSGQKYKKCCGSASAT